jgi:Holliday junction resolvase RusA-like endonuclease
MKHLESLVIPGELCDLNSYIDAERSHFRIAAKIKKEETKRVAWEFCNVKPVASYPVHIEYTWYSKDSRKDIDNIAFAVKFIHDGLVQAGVLEGDGRKHISSFSHAGFFIDKENPRVELEVKTNGL